jgi:membrane protein
LPTPRMPLAAHRPAASTTPATGQDHQSARTNANPSRWWVLRIFWDAALRWVNDGAMTSAAAIAFYTITSLGPAMVIALAIAGWVFGTESTDNAVYSQIAALVGASGARTVHTLITSAATHHEGWIANTVAPIVMAISATGIFTEIQAALNGIWRYKASPGVMTLVRVRLKGFALITAGGFVLVVSLLANAGIAAFGDALFGSEGAATFAWALHLLLALVMTAAIFAAIFKVLPDASLDWIDALIGAATAAVLTAVGRFVIGLYLATTNVATSYGAAGTFILILMWVYYSSMIFLYGAEVSWLWCARRRGWSDAEVAK